MSMHAVLRVLSALLGLDAGRFESGVEVIAGVVKPRPAALQAPGDRVSDSRVGVIATPADGGGPMDLRERSMSLVLSTLCLLMSGQALAATFVVENTVDDVDVENSLRWAVRQAEINGGPDVIQFAPGLGPISLDQELVVVGSVTLRGPVAGQVLDGNDLTRLLRFTGGDTQTLTLERMVLRRGRTTEAWSDPACDPADGRGGALCVNGNLVLDEVVIEGSRTIGSGADGGGVFVDGGTVDITNSVISGNGTGLCPDNDPNNCECPNLASCTGRGGGVAVQGGSLRIENSLLQSNQTVQGDGGGLSATGSNVQIIASVLFRNQAVTGGGIYLQGVDNTAELVNTTISGNEATNSRFTSEGGGALWLKNIDLVVSNTTVTENFAPAGSTRGIFATRSFVNPTIELSSSILAGNGADNFFNDAVDNITIHVEHSLWGDAEGEINGTNTTNVFSNLPGLTVLGSFDCAQVAGIGSYKQCLPVHGLQQTSPAIDQGANPAALTTDQRGFEFARVSGAAADIGAFEVQTAPALIVTNTNDSGPGSLRALVDRANVRIGTEDVIGFQPDLGTITLTSGQIEVSDTVQVEGPVAGQVISGNDRWRIFGIGNPNAALVLERLELRRGRARFSPPGDGHTPVDCSEALPVGGALCSAGNVTIIDGSVRQSRVEGQEGRGGGVYTAGDLTLRNSRVSFNSVIGDFVAGGGLAVAGAVNIQNSVIEQNESEGNSAAGGGLFALGTTTIESSTISGNRVFGSQTFGGGGLYLLGDSSLSQVTVSGNLAEDANVYGGAGILASDPSITLRNSTITANIASQGGGGLVMLAEQDNQVYTLRLDSVILAGNSGPEGNYFANNGVEVAAAASLDGDGELPGENLSNNEPGLGQLADNGCFRPAGAPTPDQTACVRTHLPLADSPVIDSGSNLGPALQYDQRGSGFARLFGSAPDIGAIESTFFAPGWDLIFRDRFQ